MKKTISILTTIAMLALAIGFAPSAFAQQPDESTSIAPSSSASSEPATSSSSPESQTSSSDSANSESSSISEDESLADESIDDSSSLDLLPAALMITPAAATAQSTASVADLNTAFGQLGGLGGEFALTQEFADSFMAAPATIQLPALNAGETLTIDGQGITLNNATNASINHFKAAAGNQGTYIIRNVNLIGKGGIVFTTGTAQLDTITLSSFNGGNVYSTVTGIVQANTALTVTNSTFSNSNSIVVIRGGSEPLLVQNTTFTALTGGSRAIAGDAGTVTVENSVFTSITGSHGAGVLAGTGAVSVSGSTFINNTTYGAAGYPGGVVAGHKISAGSGISVDSSYFENNVGQMYGGAVSLYYYNGNLNIRNSYFVNNSQSQAGVGKAEGGSSDGGAVGIFNQANYNSVFSITGNTFANNFANDDGGAIFIEGRNYMVNGVISNNTFVGNQGKSDFSSDSGGAVQLSLKVDAKIINNTFYNNSKTGASGAVGEHYDILSGEYPRATFQNNIFAGNYGSSTALNGKRAAISLTNGTDAGGNIGYDNYTNGNSVVLPTIDIATLFGTVSPSLSANGSSVTAGATLNGSIPVTVPTLMVSELLSGTSDNVYKAGVGAPGDGTVPAADERGIARRNPTAPGAVEATLPAPVTHTVTFDSNGGSSVASISGVIHGNVITAPVNPTRTNYNFDGWYLDTASTTSWNFATDTVTSDIILYAKWTAATPSSSSDPSSSSSSSSSTPSSSSSSSAPASSSSSTPASSSSSTAISSTASSSSTTVVSSRSAQVAASASASASSGSSSQQSGVTLDNQANPLGALNGQKAHWSLINLILSLLALALCVMVIINLIAKIRNSGEYEQQRLTIWQLLAVITGVAAPVLFLLTQNLKNQMALVDFWTLPTLALFIVQVLCVVLYIRYNNRNSIGYEQD